MRTHFWSHFWSHFRLHQAENRDGGFWLKFRFGPIERVSLLVAILSV